MFLTVAICTWNRAALLRQTLEHMTGLVIPCGVMWELVVVNNNCTDGTDGIIESYSSRLPIRRVVERNPGLSSARNAAVREARGEYIVWTDDDVLVENNWLAAYARAFQQWPEAVFFGGPIQPWFAVRPPAWLTQGWPHVASAYAERDLGAKVVRLDGGDRVPYGANFATRVREQRRYLYDPELGPKPGSEVRCEETTLIDAFISDGHEGWWVPDAVVKHYIPPERMTTRYIRRYFKGYGEYLNMTSAPWNGPTLFGKPRWLWRYAVTVEAKYRLHRIVSPPEVWIRDLITASKTWGRLLV